MTYPINGNRGRGGLSIRQFVLHIKDWLTEALSGMTEALSGKQDTLTFDDAPTAGSTNPVTSDGVKTALDGKQDTLEFDDSPTAGSANPVTSDGILSALNDLSDAQLQALSSAISALRGTAGDTAALSDYLSLGGGWMTGVLGFNKDSVFIRNKDNAAVIGHDASGANTYLSSPDGTQYLRAYDNGDLKYHGRDIELVDSTNNPTTWTGYIRYRSGLQVCFGGQNSGSGAVSVTFPAAFKSAPIIVVSRSSGDSTTGGVYNPFARKQTASSFEIYFPSSTNARWIAIGWWK